MPIFSFHLLDIFHLLPNIHSNGKQYFYLKRNKLFVSKMNGYSQTIATLLLSVVLFICNGLILSVCQLIWVFFLYCSLCLRAFWLERPNVWNGNYVDDGTIEKTIERWKFERGEGAACWKSVARAKRGQKMLLEYVCVPNRSFGSWENFQSTSSATF